MPPDSRQLSDQTECTTFDCGRIAVRMVEIEDQGKHPYCGLCASSLERSRAPHGWEDELNAAWALANGRAAEVARLRAALETTRDEMDGFATYCWSVVPDATGALRSMWQERAEWADGLAQVAREALNGGECVCAETSSRNCPTHQNGGDS